MFGAASKPADGTNVGVAITVNVGADGTGVSVAITVNVGIVVGTERLIESSSDSLRMPSIR